MINYNILKTFLTEHFSDKRINESYIGIIGNMFSNEYIIKLLNEIISEPELLQKIANRSYKHALGFDKIVLLDLQKDIDKSFPKVQVRLHIWQPQNDSVAITEALHEHSFDFVSKVITGKLENQSFIPNKLNQIEQQLLDKVLTIIPTLNSETLQKIEFNLESILVSQLQKYDSMQIIDNDIDWELLKDTFNLNIHELELLSDINGYYLSNRIAGEKKAYKHILDKYISLKIHKVQQINAGETYFHHYSFPHRLNYDNQTINSTILITTNVPENAKGGSFQRPTYETNGAKNYNKISFDIDSFKQTLEYYIEYLKKLN